ncbi:MAG TPA: hypothetical protein VFR24_10230 [Candidatus Angelobacter sp.]|nr:hypothetical protein [Candidatus Angelobacter sp.]
MRKQKLDKERNTGMSRRSALKTAAIAAAGMILDPRVKALPVPTPVDYGKNPGQLHLDPTNLFPLVTAWVLLTTNAPGSVSVAALQSVANLSPASAQAVYAKYAESDETQKAFNSVRSAFGTLAQAFSLPDSLYSGGQCPETPAKLAPIAALRGTSPAPAKARHSGK